MKTNFLPEEKMFIQSQLLFLIQSAGEAGDRDFVTRLTRIAQKFTQNSTVVPSKVKELEIIFQCTSKSEHEITNRIIPELESKNDENLPKAKELLVQIAALNKKLESYINK